MTDAFKQTISLTASQSSTALDEAGRIKVQFALPLLREYLPEYLG